MPDTMMPQERIRTPNVTVQPDQPNAGVQFVDTLLSQKAADQTIRSGLPPARQVAAAAQNKHDIVTGKQQPGFFDGIMATIQNIGGNVSQFSQTDSGKQLLQIIGGAVGGAVGGNVGGGNIGGSAGAILGGGQGVAAMQRDEALKLEKEKMQLEKDKFKLSFMELKNKMAEKGEKLPSESQIKAATFGQRLNQAESVFGELESEGYDLAGGVGRRLESAMPTGAKSAQLQRKEQAERNFVNAVLRRESGAAISPSEFDSARQQYFPQPGDRPETLEQKRKNRELAIAGLKTEAGKAWEPVAKEFTQVAEKADTGRTQIAKAGIGDTAMADDRTGQARAWAKANPNDPRAKQILAKLGG